jgi:hypothetical protein
MPKSKISESDLLDLKAAAKSIGVSLPAFKTMLKDNNTPVVIKGKSIFIKESRLQEFTVIEVPYNEVAKPRAKRVAKKTVKAVTSKKPGAKRGPKPKAEKEIKVKRAYNRKPKAVEVTAGETKVESIPQGEGAGEQTQQLE